MLTEAKMTYDNWHKMHCTYFEPWGQHTLQRATAYSIKTFQECPHTKLSISRDSSNSSLDHPELQMITCYKFLRSQDHEWVWQTYYHAIYSKAFLDQQTSKVVPFKIITLKSLSLHLIFPLFFSTFSIFNLFYLYMLFPFFH